MLQIVVGGTVPADGGSVSVALPETLDRLTLVLSTPGAMAQLDLQAVHLLRGLLMDAETLMARAAGG